MDSTEQIQNRTECRRDNCGIRPAFKSRHTETDTGIGLCQSYLSTVEHGRVSNAAAAPNQMPLVNCAYNDHLHSFFAIASGIDARTQSELTCRVGVGQCHRSTVEHGQVEGGAEVLLMVLIGYHP